MMKIKNTLFYAFQAFFFCVFVLEPLCLNAMEPQSSRRQLVQKKGCARVWETVEAFFNIPDSERKDRYALADGFRITGELQGNDCLPYNPAKVNRPIRASLIAFDFLVKGLFVWFFSNAAGLYADADLGAAYYGVLVPVIMTLSLSVFPNTSVFPVADVVHDVYQTVITGAPRQRKETLYRTLSWVPYILPFPAFLAYFSGGCQKNNRDFMDVMAYFMAARQCIAMGYTPNDGGVFSIYKDWVTEGPDVNPEKFCTDFRAGDIGTEKSKWLKRLEGLGEKVGYMGIFLFSSLLEMGWDKLLNDCGGTISANDIPYYTTLFIGGAFVMLPWLKTQGRQFGRLVYDVALVKDFWMTTSVATSVILGGLAGLIGGNTSALYEDDATIRGIHQAAGVFAGAVLVSPILQKGFEHLLGLLHSTRAQLFELRSAARGAASRYSDIPPPSQQQPLKVTVSGRHTTKPRQVVKAWPQSEVTVRNPMNVNKGHKHGRHTHTVSSAAASRVASPPDSSEKKTGEV